HFLEFEDVLLIRTRSGQWALAPSARRIVRNRMAIVLGISNPLCRSDKILRQLFPAKRSPTPRRSRSDGYRLSGVVILIARADGAQCNRLPHNECDQRFFLRDRGKRIA